MTRESAFAAQYRRYVRGEGRFPSARGLSNTREIIAQVDAELAAEAEAGAPDGMRLARELGEAAFRRGAKRVPAWDPRLHEIKPLNAQTLGAWLSAWDKANLSEPWEM